MTLHRAVRAIVRGAVVAVAVGACARPGMPEGGEVPETPLRVVDTRPANLTVVAPFDGPVVVEFERRISERLSEGTLRDAVVVSPLLGEVGVRSGRRTIEISMEGGFRTRTLYRITVLPRFQDLYQNRMAEPFDIVFSTGEELEPNLVAGIVTDRLTLEEVGGARVDMTPIDDGPMHSTVTDSTGIFSFPHLPAGSYRLVAYDDLNRNREPDFLEPQDSLEVSFARGDTLIVTEPALLAPDTTAAILQEAETIDSLAVRLTFDDHIDPDDPLDEVVVRVVREDDQELAVAEVLHLHEWEARTEPDPDTDPDDPDDPDVPADVDPVPDDGPPPILPERVLVVLLQEPLTPEVRYRVEVEGLTNINGVPGGGGDVEFEGPFQPEPEPDPDALGDPGGPGDPADSLVPDDSP